MFSKKIRILGNSLLFRLTLMYAVTFTLLAVISFSIFYYRIYSVAIERLDDELIEDTEVYAALLAARGLADFKDRLAAEAESEDPAEDFYHLFDFNGNTLFATDMTAWGTLDIRKPLKVCKMIKTATFSKQYQVLTVTIKRERYRPLSDRIQYCRLEKPLKKPMNTWKFSATCL